MKTNNIMQNDKKKLYRQFKKIRETKLCNEKKTVAAKQKEETMMKKKRIRKPTKTISVHTQKMANTNLKKKIWYYLLMVG